MAEADAQGGARAGGWGVRGGEANGAALQANFRALLGVATVEANNRGAAMIEAEHLLLGFLFDRHGQGTGVLAGLGLTYDAFDRALEQERVHTLAAVGVEIPDPARLAAAPRIRSARPRFGASAKDAWHRAARSARQRRSRGQRWTDIDLLIGILSAELGTVPRALARADLDRLTLLGALQDAATARPDTTDHDRKSR